MLLLKMYFSRLPEDDPYRFCNELDLTGVLFDTALNKDSSVVANKPLITVGRGMQSFNVAMLGDVATFSMPKASRQASNLVESAVDVHVLSRKRAEADILGERVFAMLMEMRALLPVLLPLHMVRAVTMTQAQPMEQDDQCFAVDLSMQYVMQYKWDHSTNADILQDIRGIINAPDRTIFNQTT